MIESKSKKYDFISTTIWNMSRSKLHICYEKISPLKFKSGSHLGTNWSIYGLRKEDLKDYPYDIQNAVNLIKSLSLTIKDFLTKEFDSLHPIPEKQRRAIPQIFVSTELKGDITKGIDVMPDAGAWKTTSLCMRITMEVCNQRLCEYLSLPKRFNGLGKECGLTHLVDSKIHRFLDEILTKDKLVALKKGEVTNENHKAKTN